MKAKILGFLCSLILLSASVKGQTIDGQLYTNFNNYYKWRGGAFDSVLLLPSIAASSGKRPGAIRYNPTDSTIYIWSGFQWSKISGGGVDTTSLSNRINLKQNLITLTTTGTSGNATFNQSSGALNIPNYSTDTTSLSNRINLRVRYTDTAAMLTPYLRKIDTTGAFLISVSQPNDSTLRFAKGETQTDYIIRSAVAGSATRLTTTVYNNSGSTILKGAVVYINGRHSSNLPTIALAQANNEANSYTTFALVETNIPNGSSGIVIQVGDIGNLNLPTSSYTDGQVLYLSPTVPGGYTTTKPLAPQHITKLGTVTRAHPTFGSIQIKIENGWQLDELSDVQIAAVPNDSTILQFSRVDSLWKAVDPTTAMGNRFVKRTDSAAMLLPYLRKVDTLSLSNRITAASADAIAWDGADSLYSSAQLKKGTFRTYDFDGTSGTSGIPQGSGDAIYIAAITSSGTFLNIRDNNINGISISTGGSATSNPYLSNGYANSTNVTYDITGSNIRSTWTHFRVRIPTLNDGTQRFYTVIGWKNGAGANQTETAYFTYDLDGTQTGSSASVNWQTVSALGGNREWTTTSSAVPANTWQTLSIRATTTAIQFYIDGTLVATHTTRIPGAGRMHMQIFKTNGTTARFLDVDYATFNQLNQSDR